MDDVLRSAAVALAKVHREKDPTTEVVLLAPDPEGKEIRLVEVVGQLAPSGEVIPIEYAADLAKGRPFPTVLIMLSPEEWEDCLRGGLALPWGDPRSLERIA